MSAPSELRPIRWSSEVQPPSHEEQLELSRRARAGDQAAFDEMQVRNMRLVLHWAMRYQGHGVDFDDLVQEGSFGLRRAVEKFEPDQGFKFSTYASWWIRQSLQRAVGRHARIITIPEGVLQRERDAELSEEKIELAPRVLASLDAPLGGDNSFSTFGELLPSQDPGPEELAASGFAGEEVRAALERLEPMTREVMELRWGLTGNRPLPLIVVAAQLGISVKLVKRLEAIAMESLAQDAGLADLVEVG